MVSAGRGARVRSRRERPAKAALSRAGIVGAALDILREEGLDRVTMRRVAAALDTGAASLYVYVRDTEDLHAQLLDALLAPVVAADPEGGDWRARLAATILRYVTVLFDHPGIARMALFTRPSGPHYLALVERLLALLHEGGVPDRDAAWAIDILLQLATATAAEQSVRKRSARAAAEDSDLIAALRAAAEDSDLIAALRAADPATYPQLARLGDELFAGTGSERFAWYLNVLINGTIATPRPPATAARAATIDPQGEPA